MIGIPLTLRNLVLLKWTDDEGRERKFKLIRKVSSIWRLIGNCLEFTKEKLDMWEAKYAGNTYNCWYAMIREWLEDKLPKWTDLFSVLDDIGYSKVRVDLESALTSHCAPSVDEVHPIIPPPPPPPRKVPSRAPPEICNMLLSETWLSHPLSHHSLFHSVWSIWFHHSLILMNFPHPLIQFLLLFKWHHRAYHECLLTEECQEQPKHKPPNSKGTF